MSRLQFLIVVLFTAVVFGNVYLMQPDINLGPIAHAAVVATTISLFFLAFNLKRFADLDGKPDPIVVPPAPGELGSVAEATAAVVTPSASSPATIREAADTTS